MIYEARANFADERPLHVYTEEQFKNSYNRTQRDNIKRALGQEQNRYGFYWKLGDEKTTEGDNPIEMLDDEETTKCGLTLVEVGDEEAIESDRIRILTSNVPYTREDMVDLAAFKKFLILALKPDFERAGGEWYISGKTIRKFFSEECIEEMERCHCIEGYCVCDTYEKSCAKDAAKALPNFYKLGWELRSLLVGYDIDSEGNAYSFKKYWKRCNLDKKENIS